MRILETRLQRAPAGYEFCYTEWEGVLHLTRDGEITVCGYEVRRSMNTTQARRDNKNLCPGCVPKQFNKRKE